MESAFRVSEGRISGDVLADKIPQRQRAIAGIIVYIYVIDSRAGLFMHGESVDAGMAVYLSRAYHY